MLFPMENCQFQLVYDILSFSLASMLSCTVFLFMRVPSVSERYKSAVIISGLVTFIAAYHYIRIFNSWVDAYEYPAPTDKVTNDKGEAEVQTPRITGIPFNDAYRYMDWLLTVPLLLMEIVLVMNLSKEEANSKCWTLGVGSALMIISGYKGELVLTGDLSPRWASWCFSMCFFLWVVHTLLVGLSDATNSEQDPEVKRMIGNAQVWTCISWCTYPIVYTFPMLGLVGSHAVVGIQVGYCVSDIISKCGVGLMIYQITIAKSINDRAAGLLMKSGGY
jgi:bacteriorhodopsin